jgi:hypothetical protein
LSACRNRLSLTHFRFLDEDAVHDRDLPRGTAEAQRRDLDPDAQRFGERHVTRRRAFPGGDERTSADLSVGSREVARTGRMLYVLRAR